jgi:hypothetical protein
MIGIIIKTTNGNILETFSQLSWQRQSVRVTAT